MRQRRAQKSKRQKRWSRLLWRSCRRRKMKHRQGSQLIHKLVIVNHEGQRIFDIPPSEATAEEVTATRVWEVAAVAPLALVAPALLEDAAAALEDETAALELAAAEALLPVAVAATTVVPVVEVEVEVAEAEVEDEDEEEEALQVKSKRGVVLPVVTPKLGLAPLSFKVYQ